MVEEIADDFVMLNRRPRIPKVKQHDITDCAAACLFSVAAHHGYRLSISRIRQLASTDRKGTNVLGLVEAAEKLGFTAKGVKGPFKALHRIPLPAIAHVIVDGVLPHFVVIYGVDRRRVTIMDPADGQVHKLPHADFQQMWTGVLVLLVPSEAFVVGDEITSLPRRFLELVRPHRSIMGQALLGAVLYTLLGLSTAIYVQKLVDNVIVNGNHRLLNLLGVIMVVLLIAQIYIGTMKSLFTLRTGQKIDGALILGYYKHLMRLPQRFFDTMRVGEIISRVNDAVKIRAFINDTAIDLVVSVLIVVFSLGLMFVYSWKLALLTTAVIPAYALIYWVSNRLNRRTQRQVMERAADLESQLVESLNAISTIKRFGLEWYGNLKTESRFVRLLRSVYRSGTNSLLSANSGEFVSRLFTIVLLWVGTGLVINQGLTPGELMSCYALVGYLTAPVSNVIMMNRTIQDAMIAADRLFEIMDLEREESEHKIELEPDMIDDIRFDRVSFRYGTREQVFEDLSLTIRRGEVTGIVGESGSGKSTLLSLLQNLYPIDGGHIRIGGLDVHYISNGSLRRHVAAVPQEVTLFAGNVIDNIAVGEFEPDMKRLLDVATSLGITAFVEDMPQGFHTHLGERGVSLSGGERQRIAIARALYKDPEILILDEATSSLDSVSERHVQDAIAQLKAQGKTVIVIAHRLSTVMGADRILVLEKGRLVEEGSHHDLLSHDTRYRRLWLAQFPPELREAMTDAPHENGRQAGAEADRAGAPVKG